MKKKIITFSLMLILIVSISISLVACDNKTEKDGWISFTDNIKNAPLVWIYEEAVDTWTGKPYWKSVDYDDITAEMVKNQTMPLKNYASIYITAKKNFEPNDIAKIRFIIEAEEEFLFKYYIEYETTVKEPFLLKKGKNIIELDYEEGIIRDNADKNGYKINFFRKKETAGPNWAIRDIQYMLKK